MEKVVNFAFSNIVLYAKGWYQRSENIFDDLSYLLSQVYGWTPRTEDEISYMMLQALDKLCMELQILPGSPARWYTSHASFEQEIRRRMNLYEVSREKAIVLLVLAIFQGLSRDEIKLPRPHYGKKEHFRMGVLFGENPISMTYTEMNRRAAKMFCD